jgi:hypothetical protein
MKATLSGCAAGCETDINTKMRQCMSAFGVGVDIIGAARRVCFWG